MEVVLHLSELMEQARLLVQALTLQVQPLEALALTVLEPFQLDHL